MFRCSCGQRPVVSAKTVVGSFVTDDVHALLVNCRCGSTCSAVLWQCDDFVAAELDEDEAIRLYERDEAPLDRATYRPFFSLTHELAERGL